MTTILHLSGFYDDSGLLPQDAGVLDLRDLQETCRYCSQPSAAILRGSIENLSPGGIHWIDTGDYHYLSLLWMEKIREPFILALFDNHPDDQDGAFTADLLSCGNWVGKARESLPMMKKDVRNISRIPGNLPVYLSVDIDVLSRRYARTAWSQGQMSLPELLSDIGRIFDGHRVIGADICGGLTDAAGACHEDHSTNSSTILALHAYLSTHPELAG